jgi:hypothetical protein
MAEVRLAATHPGVGPVSALFLSAEDLRELTGYSQGAAQIRWLRKNGIQHTVRVDGKPRVVPEALRPNQKPVPRQPNYDALRVRG